MDYLVYQFSSLPAGSADPDGLPVAEQEIARRRGGNYTKSRRVLLGELSRRTGLAPESIAFTYSEHGKPEFEPQPFNMSHSGDCLCIAFHHLPIGVDVERIRPRDYAQLAQRFMGEELLADFMRQECPQEMFFVCWCVAEALVKHAGDTMWHARNYPFTYRHGRVECRFPDAPEVMLFTPLPGYQGAIAYTRN